jgi:heptosyltransferase-2
MNSNSENKARLESPILLVPYMWIGDFVRCHTVIQLLRARFPNRPVDMLSTSLTAPLTDYMPGLRKAIIADLPRRTIAFPRQRELAARFKAEGYGTALVISTCAFSCRHSGTDRICRRGPLLSPQ